MAWLLTLFLSFSLVAAGRLFPEIQPNFTASNILFVDNNGAFLSSPNDTFRAALHNPLSQQFRFYLCVLHVVSNAVVWAGNRDSPVSNTGTFALSPTGILVSSSNGTGVWSTPALPAPVAWMRLGDDGNLGLFDERNVSLWESFDHPTDTVVSGQVLMVDSPVFASVSDSDLSTGKYSLMVTQSDAYLRWRSELSYWSISTDVRAFKDFNSGISFLELNDSGLFLYNSDQKLVWHVDSPSSAGIFRVAVVAADGRFVVRSFDGRNWSEDFSAPSDKCRLPLSCGPLGLCSGGSGCLCPRGFHPAAESPTAGCTPVDGSDLASPKCVSGVSNSTLFSYKRLGTGSHYFAGDYQSRVAAVSTFGACQSLCTKNCSCLGFFFQNSSSSCYFLKDELGSLFYSITDNPDRLGYIKAIPNADSGEDADKSSKKQIATAVLILLPCIGALLLIVLTSILFLWRRRSKKETKSRTLRLGRPDSSSSETDFIAMIPGMPERYKYEALERATDGFERVEIAVGTARGLAYLHGGCEHRIIHCDIKPENILLQDHFQAKISDFGLSKLMSPEQSNLFTTMRGTRGYLAPEWLTNAAISDKTDVYSYGMVLLELISGRKNCSPRGTSRSRSRSTETGSSDDSAAAAAAEYFPLVALEMHEQGRYSELADPRMEGRVEGEEVGKMVRVALCCVHEDPALRPTMAAVVAMLEGSAPVAEPRLESLHFLRFYGRRFVESVGPDGVDENRFLYQHLTTGSSSTSTNGTHTSVGQTYSYLSSQQISGPR
ncbi:hypothetical protein H6P81_010973 [Aristolochia fimbriata]|uniref:Receptor-like serine/threonine-protein kinase n=1 Tax=Aristolochia fimbriata TaxID=158543 RepID=A0AAV7EUP8_ARIFI|nr:hypothetical protein H6P81_010973 [Aristolochia fimbriata]